MNILALDLSTKRSGWAYYDENNNLVYGVVSATSADVEARIIKQTIEIIDIIKKYNIDTIIAEEVQPDGLNQHTGKVLTWLQGYLVCNTYAYNKKIKWEFIGATTWRKILGLQGYKIKREEQKRKDIAYVIATHGLKLSDSQDDEADAICILDAYNQTKPIIIDGFEFK